ncbi:MAG TPA: group II intron reverse transcriptase/maturase [Steroidobacteraceae bacterium]|jgi:RNA-directed DNA polymerase|nr:group II intron reverse transcriptase/maturase [Steroidobacteraceae bacterium]
MECVVERSNLWLAYRRVVQNQGAPGVDGLTVGKFKDWLEVHWSGVKRALLEGHYLPQPVRRVDIPKPAGGVRTLGVPTLVDRLIQQALHQVLQPLFEPTFSDGSYGFRPGRTAHQAVRRAQSYIREGKRWVVDLDLEKFFDRVNHDVLMARVARKVRDARVLKLIRRFLEAGMMREGLVEPRREGTPQGGPLSPLLSNILLTDLDRELERRKLSFCRYADDCNIYVGSHVAGERVMRGIRAFLEEVLHLRVNPAKSAVARPWERKFLGFSFTSHRQSRLRIALESVHRLSGRVRELLRAGRGRSLSHTIETLNPLLRGWITYFQLTQSKGVLEELDGWLRRRLRCLLWRQWKRSATRVRHLRALGLDAVRARQSAGNSHGPWWNAGAFHLNQALPAAYFTRLGLVSLLDTQQRLQCVR